MDIKYIKKYFSNKNIYKLEKEIYLNKDKLKLPKTSLFYSMIT